MGASVLPATIYKNKVYLLFGKERDTDDTPGWSDFGGGTDNGETFLATAEREGGEELTGFLGDKNDIKQLLKKHGTFNIDFKSDGHTTYRVHIFPMEYDDKLPYYYNNNQKFLQRHLDASVIRDTKIFEKTQIKWFCIDDLKHNRGQFRSFYKNIIDLIIQDRRPIEIFIRRSLKHKNIRFRLTTTIKKRNRNKNKDIKSRKIF